MAQGRNAWDRAGAREIMDTESEATVLIGDVIDATEKVQNGQVSGSGGGSGTAITTTQNASPQTAPDGSRTQFTFAHDHPARPQSAILVPRSRAATGLPWLVSAGEEVVTFEFSAAPPADASIVGDVVTIGSGPTGPVTMADFESTSLADSFSGRTNDPDHVFIAESEGYDGSAVLEFSRYNNDDRVVVTNATFDVLGRDCRVQTKGSPFGSVGYFGVACSGTSFGDLTGYVIRTNTNNNDSFRLSRYDSGEETRLYESSSAGVPEGPWHELSLSVEDDGTVTGAIVDIDNGSVIHSGSGVDDSASGLLTSGRTMFGGDPRSTDDLSVRFDNAVHRALGN